jgi:MFS family permease
MAASVFAMAPFLGPSIGPIVGGFLVSLYLKQNVNVNTVH